jgi:hypothetical protein
MSDVGYRRHEGRCRCPPMLVSDKETMKLQLGQSFLQLIEREDSSKNQKAKHSLQPK